jgi:hypothetical protein
LLATSQEGSVHLSSFLKMLAGFSVAIVLVACAAGTPAPAANAEYADADAFCQSRAEAECSDAVVKGCGIKDAATCGETRKASCLSSVPQGLTYVPANAPACLDLVKSVYATGTITSDANAKLPTTCGTDPFSGAGQARAACGSDRDCSTKDGLQLHHSLRRERRPAHPERHVLRAPRRG